ncbi:unnamed protein product [Alopecurus aequalis]
MEQEGARRPHGGGADIISALPEDLLLHVLRRLGCARAAARTSLLSRHWRGLWTRIPDLIFRNVPVHLIQAALSSLPDAVSLLDITFFSLQAAAGVPLPTHELWDLLDAAAGLSPVDFRLTLPGCLGRADTGLPGFSRTTSIQMYADNLHLTLPRSGAGGAFPNLERLTLLGCYVDVTALLLLCPRLRVLRVNQSYLDAGINIRSESLQKLSLRTARERNKSTDSINVAAPVLEQLALSISTHTDLSVSVIAPILEKVSWECSYDTRITGPGLACWGLSKVSLYAAAESLRRHRVLTCLQLSHVYVLSLEMFCRDWFQAQLDLVQQLEKHLVTDFSILDLTMGYNHNMGSRVHVFGPVVLHLLGMHRIRTTTRRLQIHFRTLDRKAGFLPENCRCDEPKNWRSKNISLINLEEVEINGFGREDHEFDFLKVIFRCAPMLKRLVLRTSDEVRTSDHQCTKIQDIFKAYPFVECKLIHRRS